MSTEDDFCDVIKKARFGLGLSREDVAQAAAMRVAALNALESDGSRPTMEQCHALADTLRLHPGALWQLACGWTPPALQQQNGANVHQVVFPEMNSNGYVITWPGSNETFVVDPGGRPDDLLDLCRGPVSAVLLTHTHHDHVAALLPILAAHPDAVVVVHEAGKAAVPPGATTRIVAEDTMIRLGPVPLHVWLAPGHSDDGLLFVWGQMVFTGDTLFAGSLGRSGAGPVTYDTLLTSARRVLSLDNDTRVYAGHGPPTTVAWEKQHNPFIAEGRTTQHAP